MFRIFIGLLAIVLVLAGVVVGRTLMVPVNSPPITSEHAATPSTFDAAVVAAHLSEAVKFRTISWQEGADAADEAASQAAFVAFRDWIAATYPQFANTATREIVGDYSLLFTWAGSDPALKPILLMSHMDVVPIAPGSEKNWTHDPFAGEIADGFVWGRGTLDTKGGIVGMLDAAEALIASGFKPKRTILFAFGHDEEKGGANGNAKISALLAARNVKLEFVDDEGGVITNGVLPGITAPVALVGIAEKGFVSIELTAHSQGGHSSLPVPVAETAIGRLARAIMRVGDAPFESKIDGIARDQLSSLMPAMPFERRLLIANLWLFEPLVVRAMNASPAGGASLHTTIAPTIISGGNKENVLPPDAKVTINFRIHPRDTIDSVVAHVRQAVDDDQVDVNVSNKGRAPSPVSNVDGPQYALIRRTLNKIMPGVIVVPNLVVAGTDSRYYQRLTDNVFRMVPAVMGPDDLKGFHGTNERMPVASMGLIAQFYSTLISSLDELEPGAN
ncbi:MAG: M20 family peptidase [Alphaproteobacteria bacterium]|nr:M20 family peptidase [Alphaproteobacteria bacterium]